MILHGVWPDKPSRRTLLEIYQAALTAVNGEQCVRRALAQYPRPAAVCLLAIGKAAASMTAGACASWGDVIQSGLVITRYGYDAVNLVQYPQLQVIEAAHPVPDQNSLRAGEQLLGMLEQQAESTELLFLISGGTSSLVEVLHDGIDLADLQQINTYLLSAGWSIERINRVRRCLSKIKGGGLLAYCQGRPVRCLLISDVPGDDPALIGSGLLFPDPDPQPQVDEGLPDWIRAKIPMQQRFPVQAPVSSSVIASNHIALSAAAQYARERGFQTQVFPDGLHGEAQSIATQIMQVLDQGGPGVYLWGGEATVVLPETPGRGGRAQHLALCLAQRLQGRDDIEVLAMGTDGSDGPGEDAGALIDGYTVSRGAIEGYDVSHMLARADAGGFLEASGDLVQTGPTGSNVMDVLIALKH